MYQTPLFQAATFDRLTLTRHLAADGTFTREQAERLAEGMQDMVMNTAATRQDLEVAKADNRAEHETTRGMIWKANLALAIWITGVVLALRFIH